MNEDEDIMAYCPKCGYIGRENDNCCFCGTKEIATPYSWDKLCYERAYDFDVQKKILEEYVKPNPLFDEELYNKRVGIEKAQEQATLNQMRIKKQLEQQANKPKCPTCGSTSIRRISTLDRAVSIGILGIFSGKIGKNYECLNCKAKW